MFLLWDFSALFPHLSIVLFVRLFLLHEYQGDNTMQFDQELKQ
jgi:hypothetical protein